MNARFTFQPTPLAGLTMVERKPISDDRGFLERLFCADEFATEGLRLPMVQANRTVTTRKGTVRGMHLPASASRGDKACFVSYRESVRCCDRSAAKFADLPSLARGGALGRELQKPSYSGRLCARVADARRPL